MIIEYHSMLGLGLWLGLGLGLRELVENFYIVAISNWYIGVFFAPLQIKAQ